VVRLADVRVSFIAGLLSAIVKHLPSSPEPAPP
jgi:hypothetical protein